MAQRKSLNVNGKAVQVTIDDPDMPLLYALRDNLALHGRASDAGLRYAAPARCTSTARRCARA
jgi:nicotinate dehydrogenase subunit A